MLKYNFSDYYLLYLMAIITNCVIFAIIYFIVRIFLKSHLYLFEKGRIIYFTFISISFAFLALTTGLLTGTSKSPVVGVIIPSILTFYAGLMTYLFIFSNKENRIENSISVGISIMSMSLFLLVGADYGADMREKAENMEKESTFRRELEKMEIEYKIKNNKLSIESPTEERESKSTKNDTLPTKGPSFKEK